MAGNFYPQFSKEIKEILSSRFNFSEAEFQSEDTNESLAKRICDEAKKQGKTILNYIPSQFDCIKPESFDAIPQYQFSDWKTLDENLDFFDIKGGALWVAPAVWQWTWPFHKMCRQHKLFAAFGDVNNIPLSVEIIRQAKISCWVAPENVAIKLHEEMLKTKNTDNTRLAIVLKDVRDVKYDSDYFQITGAQTIWEIQLFPGHTIAYQTFALSGNVNSFHLSDDYLWRFEDGATYITAIKPEVLPVFNYKLPVVVEPIKTMAKLRAFSFHHA